MNGVDRELFLAENYLERGKSAQAKACIATVLAQEPDHYDALLLGARCQLEVGEAVPALETLRRAAAREPDDAWLFLLQAQAFLLLERFPDALLSARTAQRLAPDKWQTHSYLATVAFRSGYVDDSALEAAHTAVRLDPREPETHVSLGWVLLSRKSEDLAKAAFAEALKIDPQNVDAVKGIGAVELQQGSFGPALEMFANSLKLEPTQETLGVMSLALTKVLTAFSARLMVLQLAIILFILAFLIDQPAIVGLLLLAVPVALFFMARTVPFKQLKLLGHWSSWRAFTRYLRNLGRIHPNMAWWFWLVVTAVLVLFLLPWTPTALTGLLCVGVSFLLLLAGFVAWLWGSWSEIFGAGVQSWKDSKPQK